ncbi:MAG: peptidoglycan DD-metalloendopeptidase family protein [Pseudobdellovibrionaceae bacterium]|jgi:murein DD-endopeptidase MepM/ murein hydrolase activator NlpD|nr:peptidoglycan DD-metalloendopeptidase family protein [Pseudobdellovibrionaceae bacterium]
MAGEKVKTGLLLAVSLIVVSSCAQSGGGVAVHQYGEAAHSKDFGVHTIQSGETLYGIAQSYRVELRDLLDLNNLLPPYNVKAGTRVRIPKPRTYTVQGGDTLYRVSRIFDTTTTELATLNRLRSPYTISTGQSIRIPGLRPERAVAIAKSAPVPVFGQTAKVDKVQSEALPTQKIASQKPQASSVMGKGAGQPSVSQPPVSTLSSSSSSTPPPSSMPKVLASTQPPPSSGSGFLRPVSGKVISSYGPKKDGLHNDGINIKAPKGTAVRAAENGTVVYSGSEIDGYGNLVLVRHSGGYVTAYAHLDKMLAKKGDVLKRGQTLGTVGASGHVDSPQLHFEIRKGRKALNPATMI